MPDGELVTLIDLHTRMAMQGCQWIANSGSAGGSGSCVPVNSSSSQFPYVFTIAASVSSIADVLRPSHP